MFMKDLMSSEFQFMLKGIIIYLKAEYKLNLTVLFQDTIRFKDLSKLNLV